MSESTARALPPVRIELATSEIDGGPCRTWADHEQVAAAVSVCQPADAFSRFLEPAFEDVSTLFDLQESKKGLPPLVEALLERMQQAHITMWKENSAADANPHTAIVTCAVAEENRVFFIKTSPAWVCLLRDGKAHPIERLEEDSDEAIGLGGAEKLGLAVTSLPVEPSDVVVVLSSEMNTVPDLRAVASVFTQTNDLKRACDGLVNLLGLQSEGAGAVAFRFIPVHSEQSNAEVNPLPEISGSADSFSTAPHRSGSPPVSDADSEAGAADASNDTASGSAPDNIVQFPSARVGEGTTSEAESFLDSLVDIAGTSEGASEGASGVASGGVGSEPSSTASDEGDPMERTASTRDAGSPAEGATGDDMGPADGESNAVIAPDLPAWMNADAEVAPSADAAAPAGSANVGVEAGAEAGAGAGAEPGDDSNSAMDSGEPSDASTEMEPETGVSPRTDDVAVAADAAEKEASPEHPSSSEDGDDPFGPVGDSLRKAEEANGEVAGEEGEPPFRPESTSYLSPPRRPRESNYLWPIVIAILIGLALGLAAVPGGVDVPGTSWLQGLFSSAAPVSPTGTLHVEPFPPAKQIWIDGEAVAEGTPARFDKLAVGKRRVALDLGICGIWETTVHVEEGGVAELRPIIEGSVKVSAADPTRKGWAWVEGGEKVAIPATLSGLTVGWNRIFYEDEALPIWERQVFIRSDDVSTLIVPNDVQLGEGLIKVESFHFQDRAGLVATAGDSVWVNSEFAGMTPLEVRLNPGYHAVRVSTPEENYNSVLELRGGGTHHVLAQFGLEPRPQLVHLPPGRVAVQETLVMTLEVDSPDGRGVRGPTLHFPLLSSEFREIPLTRLEESRSVYVAIADAATMPRSSNIIYYFSALAPSGEVVESELYNLWIGGSSNSGENGTGLDAPLADAQPGQNADRSGETPDRPQKAAVSKSAASKAASGHGGSSATTEIPTSAPGQSEAEKATGSAAASGDTAPGEGGPESGTPQEVKSGSELLPGQQDGSAADGAPALSTEAAIDDSTSGTAGPDAPSDPLGGIVVPTPEKSIKIR